MQQVSCNYKRENTETKCPLCKKSEVPQSICWNVKKIKSSHLVKKTARENGKRLQRFIEKIKRRENLQ